MSDQTDTIDELRKFAKAKLSFDRHLPFPMRNKARHEIHAKLELSALRGTDEWTKLRTELEGDMKLETVPRSGPQDLYMFARCIALCICWLSYTLAIPVVGPIWWLYKKNAHRLGNIDVAAHLAHFMVWQTACLCGTEVNITGASKRKLGGHLQVYNHSTSLDPVVLNLASLASEGKFAGSMIWVYKKELQYVPGIGQILWLFGCLPLDRSNRNSAIAALQAIGPKAVAQKQNVSIAPEGTRSKSGYLLEFKKGCFHLRKSMKCELVPVYIAGAYEMWPAGQLTSYFGQVNVLFGDPIVVSEDEDTDKTRLQLWKDYHERLPLVYDSRIGAPVSSGFMVQHLLQWLIVYYQANFVWWAVRLPFSFFL